MTEETLKLWNFDESDLKEAIMRETDGKPEAYTKELKFMKSVVEKAQAENDIAESAKGFFERLIDEKNELKERISALSKALGIDENDNNNYPRVNLPKNSKISKFQADHMFTQLSDMKSYYDVLCIRIGDLA